MKYLIVVPDGAGDDPMAELQGKTPLEVANMPYINELASRGQVGWVQTIPQGIAPGSDAANLSVMGYDPAVYLTGRSPLEAASMGIDMNATDVAFRVNLVTLGGSGEYEQLTIEDHSAGDIPTEEASQLIEALSKEMATDKIKFYTGISYRHCMIVGDGSTNYTLTPPHDALGQKTKGNLPIGEGSEWIYELMAKSYEILKVHPVNKMRIKKGLRPANSIWIWGQGTKPQLSSFWDKYAISGSAISAVDLIKGIAICAGLSSIDVEGATGTLHTNFEGKAKAAIDEFQQGKDFVYLHLEGPDECSHQGDLKGKIKCLEDIDQKIVKPVCEHLKVMKEYYRVLVVPDHRTPLGIRTHSAKPVPFVLYASDNQQEIDNCKKFNEEAGAGGRFFESGFDLADYFFGAN